jgi:hypothetical protein
MLARWREAEAFQKESPERMDIAAFPWEKGFAMWLLPEF